MSGTDRPTRDQYLLRNRVADEVTRRAERTGDASLPWAAVPAMAEAFGDETAVLTHLAARWSRNLAGSLDPVLDLPDAERERAAADVAAALAARRPGLHAVLHHHRDHPAVRAAREIDRAMAGLVYAPVQAGHVAPHRGVVRALHGLAGREWEWMCASVSRTHSSLRRVA